GLKWGIPNDSDSRSDVLGVRERTHKSFHAYESLTATSWSMAMHFLENSFHRLISSVNASTKSFNKFISFFPYFKCEHLWLTAAYVNRCIHNKPRKRGTDRRLSKKVMTDGLNNLNAKLTVTHQSTMCTTSHLNLVIWQNQSIG